MDKIITGDLHFRKYRSYDSFAIIEHSRLMAMHGIQSRGAAVGIAPLVAAVNHGRWIVYCECGGAEFAWDYDGKSGLFMCQSCWNASHGHQYRPFVFPAARQSIEKELVKRPQPARNWRPGESIENLKSENKAHREELLK